VSQERRQYNDTEARLWEQMRRQGADLVYFRRREAEGRERDDARGQKRQPVLVPWDEHAGERFPRAVILGDPGLGKTWVLRFEARHLARTMAAKLRNQTISLQEAVVPIFARLGDVARALHDEVPLEEALLTLIRRDYHKTLRDAHGQEHAADFSEAFLTWMRAQLAHQRCSVLLDALDEVPEDRRETLQHSLSRFAERYPHSRLLLTSRIVSYGGSPIDNAEELELVGLNSEQQTAFIRVWYTGTREGSNAQSAGLEELLTRHAPLQGLAQVPLMLWMICQVHSMGEFGATMRRVDLYSQCLTGLLGKWSKQKYQPQSQVELTSKEKLILEAKLALLAPIALQLFTQNKEMFTVGEVSHLLGTYYDRLPAHDPLKVAWQAKSSADMLEELEQEDGILITAGQGEDAPRMFVHLTFQEFLAATAIATEVNTRGWQTTIDVANTKVTVQHLVDRKAWDPRWQEVLLLLAGQLNNPEPLLTLLVDEKQDDFFRHRLALAALCLPELPLPIRDALSARVDQITTAAFSLWWEYSPHHTEAAVAHLTRILPALSHTNGRVCGRLRRRRGKTVLQATKTNDSDDIPLLEWIWQELHNQDGSVRVAATWAVGQLGSAAATPAFLAHLAALLQDQDGSVRWAAARVVEHLMEQGIRIFQEQRRKWVGSSVEALSILSLDCL